MITAVMKLIKPGWLLLPLLLVLACGQVSNTAEEHVARAQELQDRGELRAAVIELKNALQKSRDHSRARLMLGGIYIEIGDGASAEKELRRALELGISPNVLIVPLTRALVLQENYEEVLTVDQLLTGSTPEQQLTSEEQAILMALKGDAYYALGDLEESDLNYEAALSLNPGSVEARVGKAMLATRRGNFSEARDLLEQAIQSEPDAAAAWHLLGDLERIDNNLVAAEQAYGKAIAARRLNTNDRLKRTLVRIALKDYDGASSDLEVLNKQAPHLSGVSYARGLLAFQQGKYAEAEESFQTVVSSTPDYLPAIFYLGVVEAIEEKWEMAESHLNSILRHAPQQDEPRLVLAAVRLRRHDYAGAEAVLEPLKPRAADNPSAAKMLGFATAQQGKFEEAARYFKLAGAAEPDSSINRLNLGLSLLLTKNQGQGLEEIKAAIELDDQFQAADLALVMSFMSAQQFDEALKAAGDWHQRQQENPVPLNLMAVIHMSRSETEKSRLLLEQAVELAPAYPPAVHNLAALELSEGNTKNAKALYRELLQHQPSHLRTFLKLAELEVRDGNLDSARSLLKQAISENPEDIEPRLLLSNDYMQQGKPEQALEMLQGVSSTNMRGQTMLLLRTGEAQLAIEKYQEAVSTFQDLVSLIPQSANAHYLLAKAYAGTGNVKESTQEIDLALQLHPENIPVNLAKARSLFSQGKLEAANELMATLGKTYPDSPEVLAGLAWLAMQQDRFEEGIATYREAYDKAPSSELAVRIALAQLQNSDAGGAVATLEARTSRHPEDVVVWRNLANLYRAVGDGSKAQAAFLKVLEEQPDDVHSLNSMAWMLRESDPKRALAYVKRAAELAPESPQVLDTLGVVLIENGDGQSAVRALESALVRSTGNESLDATIVYHLAVALSFVGDTEQARLRLDHLLAKETAFAERNQAMALLESLGK